jgi:GNAT superfamily N-acetyltransferase
MEISIRRIAREDAAAISELSCQLGYPLSSEQTLQNIEAVMGNKDHDAFAAVYESNVIGWIGIAYSIQIEMPPYCEIRGLVVDDKYRKSGIGKMLIEKARQWAKERGNDKLRLRCNVIRTETHLFYQHLGFKETKQQKVFEIKI